jgi:hypothetical protein
MGEMVFGTAAFRVMENGIESVRKQYYAKINGGLHTVAGWEHFKGLSGIEAISEHVLANEVRVIELPRSAFNADSFKKASNAASELGYSNPIKTLFPAHWSPGEIIDAVNEANEFGKEIKGRGDWGITKIHKVRGVDIEVQVNRGKIGSAFPHLERK